MKIKKKCYKDYLYFCLIEKIRVLKEAKKLDLSTIGIIF